MDKDEPDAVPVYTSSGSRQLALMSSPFLDLGSSCVGLNLQQLVGRQGRVHETFDLRGGKGGGVKSEAE